MTAPRHSRRALLRRLAAAGLATTAAAAAPAAASTDRRADRPSPSPGRSPPVVTRSRTLRVPAHAVSTRLRESGTHPRSVVLDCRTAAAAARAGAPPHEIAVPADGDGDGGALLAGVAFADDEGVDARRARVARVDAGPGGRARGSTSTPIPTWTYETAVDPVEYQPRDLVPAGDGGAVVLGRGYDAADPARAVAHLLRVDGDGREAWATTLAAPGAGREPAAIARLGPGRYRLAGRTDDGRAWTATLDASE